MSTTTTTLTLFCLVDGEATSNAFPVEIEPSKSIGSLKKVIKSEKTPRFDDIAADELTLWRVHLPISDADDDTPILLEHVTGEKKLGPATRLTKAFPEELPEETIHILVQRPPQDLISEREFLQCIPGAIIGVEQEWSSGRISTTSSVLISPSTIQLWDIENSIRDMELETTPKYSRPRFKENRIFRPESDLHDLFKDDLGSIHVLPPNAKTERPLRLMRGISDLACYRQVTNPNDQNSPLFPIEIKRPIILQSDDLVGQYRAGERSVIGPVNQAFGYMRLNGFRYGVLSTYEKTWFLQRSDDDDADSLKVSPMIAYNRSDPTLLQCYLWFIRQAANDERPPDPPSDKEKDRMLKIERKKEEKRRNTKSSKKTKHSFSPFSTFTRRGTGSASSKTTTRLTLPSFEKMELISHGERAQTYRASWQGHDIVVKKCDVWNQGSVAEELKHEAMVYQWLESLQGQVIPEVWLAGVADGLEMVVATTFVGKPINQEHLDGVARRKIRKALSAIHQLGVLHGDIRPENITVEHCGPDTKFYFIDFGLARFTTDKIQLQEEMEDLNSLLSILSV